MQYYDYYNYRNICTIYNHKCKTLEYIEINIRHEKSWNISSLQTQYTLKGITHNPKGPAFIKYDGSSNKYIEDYCIHGRMIKRIWHPNYY